eukprot:scaffold1149_cov27-Tisochrysis_lutea.AAC.1
MAGHGRRRARAIEPESGFASQGGRGEQELACSLPLCVRSGQAREEAGVCRRPNRRGWRPASALAPGGVVTAGGWESGEAESGRRASSITKAVLYYT